MANSNCAYMFQCQDFAEEEATLETLALKFKNEEIASKFRKIFEETVAKANAAKDATPKKVVFLSCSNDC